MYSKQKQPKGKTMKVTLTKERILEVAATQTTIGGLIRGLGYSSVCGATSKKIKAMAPEVQGILAANKANGVSAPAEEAPKAKKTKKVPKVKAKAPKAPKKGKKLPTKSTKKTDVIQTAAKVSAHGYRASSGYAIFDRLASEKPVEREALITGFCDEKAAAGQTFTYQDGGKSVTIPWSSDSDRCRAAALESLKVVCNPAQRSNRNKTANAEGGTLTKGVTHIHLVAAPAVEEETEG
jgi:hypothetical protein